MKTRRIRPTAIALAACLGTAGPLAADVQPDAGMLRYPAVSAERIVFVYANDLWTVDRDGGQAVPLASPPGGEMFPRFDPTGQTIGFVGNYDGNKDLYTVPVGGGVPWRVTHHPATEVLSDWTPDGRLLFFARGIAGNPRATQLFTVPAEGGMPEMLPVPYGAMGAISPDGAWLAYTPHTRDHRTWKRYRGGMATDIWLFNLRTNESRRITDWEGTDSVPMWHGSTVYYLSDNGPEERMNIWSYDVATGRRAQVTRFDEYDIKWPSIGPGDRGQGEIVFQNGSELYLLDLGTQRSRSVRVTIPGARPTIRPQHVDASEFTGWWQISPTGKRGLVVARGDVWTLPAKNGSPRNLTRTSGAAEQQAAWSPDGRWIAYFGDATGEYELYVTQSDGKGETKQLTRGSRTYYTDPVWSPDSKMIAFNDKAGRIWLHTIDDGVTVEVMKDPWGDINRPSWSHDSRWLAYPSTSDERRTPAIWVYEVETGERTQLTSGMFPDDRPAFDRKGDYLYFTSERNFSPTYSDLDTTFVYRDSGVLLAAPLRADVKSPWLEESDEEEWSEDDEEGDENGDDEEEDADDGEEDDEDGDDDEGDDEEPEDDGVSGTYEGTLNGADLPPGMAFSLVLSLAADGTFTGNITVPMGSGEVEGTYDRSTGDIRGTITTEEGDELPFTGSIKGDAITMTATMQGMAIEIQGTRTSKGVDADADEKKGDDKAREVVEIDVDGFEARAMLLPVPPGRFGDLAVNDKNQLLYTRFVSDGLPSIKLFDLEDDKKEEKTVATGGGGYEMSADGKKILTIRGNGASIQNASAGATGKNVVTAGMHVTIDPREEWAQILNEAWRLQRDFFYVENMHGVDWPAIRDRYTMMLDDCVTRDDVAFIIREMIAELNVGHAYYRDGETEEEPQVTVGMLGVDWSLHDGAYRIDAILSGGPWDADARGPLSAPGIDVKAGDYLLAVNGLPVDTSRDIWAAFPGTAGRTVTLTVSEKPVMDEDARTVAVKPMPSESELRYRAWIEANRAHVEARTDGQVGYIYVPNTGVDGQNDLFRQFVSHFHRKALIIDERWNGGGQIPTRFIELLNRPVTNYWARRDGQEGMWPPDSHQGPKCMLINGLAGSGGDMFPWLFRQAGLGKLIGMRTWGGLVGISGNPGLVDGAGVTVPTFGFYETDGTWGVEGHGVDPDIEVIDDPALMVDGGDPQLDAAIDLMLDELRRNPYVPPRRPADPDRSGIGILERDK